jgi:trigger factor
MQTQITEPEYCKLNISCEIEDNTISDKKSEIINKLKSAKIPGFRPGKATTDAIKLHFRKEINAELKRELAQEAVQNALFENNIKPIGEPNFSVIDLEDKKFRCEFTIHKFPDFELAEYKSFQIPKPAEAISVEDFSQKMLQELRVKYGNTVPYGENDFVQMDDTITLDFAGFYEDETPIPNLTATGQLLNVGRINIPGFSENLLGMTPNETREFTLKIPENYQQQELANKILKFVVKVLMGSRQEPAALDDELAKTCGVENFDKLLEAVKSLATTKLRETEKVAITNQISNRLIANHDFKVPEWISLAEAQMNIKSSGKNWDELSDAVRLQCIDAAAKSVKLSLVLQKVRENEPEAQLTEEEALNIAKQNIAQFSKEPEKVLSEIYKNGHLGFFLNRVRDEFALDYLQKTCEIVG